jgi:hypothetical protein
MQAGKCSGQIPKHGNLSPASRPPLPPWLSRQSQQNAPTESLRTWAHSILKTNQLANPKLPSPRVLSYVGKGEGDRNHGVISCHVMVTRLHKGRE